MEPITTTMIATLILSKAAEESGKKLGEAVSTKVSQLLSIIQEKFKAEGVEGKLIKAQENPSEKNKGRLEQELAAQMEDDESFAENVKNLVKELRADPNIQIFFKGVDVKGGAKIGNVKQTKKMGGGVQEAIVDVKVGGDFVVGDVEQQG